MGNRLKPKAVEAAMAYERIKDNEDFKKVVEFYTQDVAMDFAEMYAFNGIDETMRKEAGEKMSSCFNFKAYLQELENAMQDLRNGEDDE